MPVTTPIFYIHIPKTGGISFEKILSRNIKRSATCPYYYDTDFLAHPDAELNYQLFWGHNWYYTLGILPAGTRPVTFLRHPVERAFSAFEHCGRDPGHRAHAYVQSIEAKPGRMNADDRFFPMFSNVCTRMLGADFDLQGLRRQRQDNRVTARSASRTVKSFRRSLCATDELLERAKQRLAAMPAFGLTERYDASLRWLTTALDLEPVSEAPHANAAPGKRPSSWTEKYSAADVTRMKHLNEFDLALYDYAVELFDKRTANAVPVNN